jgi:hypothetical protein
LYVLLKQEIGATKALVADVGHDGTQRLTNKLLLAFLRTTRGRIPTLGTIQIKISQPKQSNSMAAKQSARLFRIIKADHLALKDMFHRLDPTSMKDTSLREQVFGDLRAALLAHSEAVRAGARE